MAELWSDFTGAVIKDVDKSTGGKFGFSIEDFLSEVPKYAGSDNIEVTISNMREAVNSHIDELLQEIPEQAKALEDSISRAGAVTKQISQNLAMQARQHNVPIIKPVRFDRGTTSEEMITIGIIDDQVLKLVEKLASESTLIADFSYQFKATQLGSWLFSGGKNYLLNVHVPPSDAYNLELARAELKGLFDAAGEYIRGY